MATYVTPEPTHHHYVEDRDTGSGAGIWAVVAVLIVLFALLFFGSNLFGNRGGSGTGTDVDIRGNIDTGGSGGSGGAGTAPTQ